MALSTLTTAILQGFGKLQEPLIHCAIALVVHIVSLVVFMRNFNLNIYGVIYSNIVFAFIICILNALSIKRYLAYRQEVYRTFVVPALASIIMAGAAYAVYSLFHLFAGNSISTIIAIGAGMGVYAVGLVAFKGITIEELATMPKGNLIIKIFRKLGLLR